jgi:hypothetical protein
LSAHLDEYGREIIAQEALEEFRWLVSLLQQTVPGYPSEWTVEGGWVVQREAILQQLTVLAGIVERARAEGRVIESWGE